MSGSEAIPWGDSYEAALPLARREGRPLLVHFAAPGRPLCARMQEETFADAEVVRLARDAFVAVHVDPQTRADLFARLVGGRGALASAVVDGEEDVVSLLVGFAAPAPFRDFLARARDGTPRLRAARRVTARRPRAPEALLALAETYADLASSARAEATYARVVAEVEARAGLDETSRHAGARARERLARLEIERGHNQEARRHLDAVAALDPALVGQPDEPLALTWALVLTVERRLDEARAALLGVLAQFPKGEERDRALVTLALVEHERGEDATALAHLEETLRAHPTSRWRESALVQIEHIKNPGADHQH